MEELIRNETLQLVLIGLSGPALLIFIIMTMFALARLFPEASCESRREYQESERRPQQQSAQVQSGFQVLEVQPTILRMNGEVAPLRSVPTPLSYWSQHSLPSIQGVSALSPASQLLDPAEDEPINSFINVAKLLADTKVVDGVEIDYSLLPNDLVTSQLAEYLDFCDGVDWGRALPLLGGVPVGYPSIGYEAIQYEDVSDEEKGEVFDALFSDVEIEIRELTEDEHQEILAEIVSTSRVIIIN